MTATEELRRLLDERGVEWSATVGANGTIWTHWDAFNGQRIHAMDNEDGTVEIFDQWDLTPEQAIAATLGRGTCHPVPIYGFDGEFTEYDYDGGGRMNDELKPCPFCGWQGIHMRKKTQMRESVTGFMYMRGYDQFNPVSLGYVGQDFREVHCYDYRFGIRFYCGKCRAETPYIWGEWHLPTEDEVETFDDLPHACERFDPDEERETIGKAIAAWNRRAQ